MSHTRPKSVGNFGSSCVLCEGSCTGSGVTSGTPLSLSSDLNVKSSQLKFSYVIKKLFYLPSDPFDQLLHKASICGPCLDKFSNLEQLISDLDILQGKLTTARKEIENNLQGHQRKAQESSFVDYIFKKLSTGTGIKEDKKVSPQVPAAAVAKAKANKSPPAAVQVQKPKFAENRRRKEIVVRSRISQPSSPLQHRLRKRTLKYGEIDDKKTVNFDKVLESKRCRRASANTNENQNTQQQQKQIIETNKSNNIEDKQTLQNKILDIKSTSTKRKFKGLKPLNKRIGSGFGLKISSELENGEKQLIVSVNQLNPLWFKNKLTTNIFKDKRIERFIEIEKKQFFSIKSEEKVRLKLISTPTAVPPPLSTLSTQRPFEIATEPEPISPGSPSLLDDMSEIIKSENMMETTGPTTPATPTTKIRFPCDSCHRTFDSKQGLVLHKAKSHPIIPAVNDEIDQLKLENDGGSSNSGMSGDFNNGNGQMTGNFNGNESVSNLKNSCQYCKKIFPDTYKLNRHVEQIHLRVKKYKCTICPNKAFIEKWALKNHVDSKHLGIKYSCKICNKQYSTPYILQVHEKTHDGEFTYKCPVESCSKGFNSKMNFEKHCRNIHKIDQPIIEKKIRRPKQPKEKNNKSKAIVHNKEGVNVNTNNSFYPGTGTSANFEIHQNQHQHHNMDGSSSSTKMQTYDQELNNQNPLLLAENQVMNLFPSHQQQQHLHPIPPQYPQNQFQQQQQQQQYPQQPQQPQNIGGHTNNVFNCHCGATFENEIDFAIHSSNHDGNEDDALFNMGSSFFLSGF